MVLSGSCRTPACVLPRKSFLQLRPLLPGLWDCVHPGRVCCDAGYKVTKETLAAPPFQGEHVCGQKSVAAGPPGRLPVCGSGCRGCSCSARGARNVPSSAPRRRAACPLPAGVDAPTASVPVPVPAPTRLPFWVLRARQRRGSCPAPCRARVQSSPGATPRLSSVPTDASDHRVGLRVDSGFQKLRPFKNFCLSTLTRPLLCRPSQLKDRESKVLLPSQTV